ncbi:twin-arginine translocase subunit TatC [Tuberibacillus sp. Marseille-P3662]|uniref:twin-arginine translocase subunit TatC n=1 Tax=Tuberibacillus sp. Marseille-P3662 TaxID=1965358 RepID=UPI000A1CC41F|nr:twin-arginine translocase subunit TatC [Tuberibacillus sp. Marseille-P3662]
MADKYMSMTEHIHELRRRLMIVAIGFVIAFVVGFFLSKPLILYLQKAEEAKGVAMNAFRVTDPLNIFIQMAFVIGIIIALPLILYQIWAFIAPGLYKKEQKVTLAFIPLAVLLFLGGLAFSYYILFPYTLNFMGNLSTSLNIESEIGINEYFRFLLQITLPFGFVFQLPILVMFLTRLGLVTPALLHRIRKYAYFVLLIMAGFITPPDVISQLIVMVPLVILYEVSIVISRMAYRQKIKSLTNENQ